MNVLSRYSSTLPPVPPPSPPPPIAITIDWPLEIAGFGAFGKVYKGRRKGTAEIVALKFIAKRGRSRKDLDLLYAE